jgi:FkbM family methyltransferase
MITAVLVLAIIALTQFLVINYLTESVYTLRSQVDHLQRGHSYIEEQNRNEHRSESKNAAKELDLKHIMNNKEENRHEKRRVQKRFSIGHPIPYGIPLHDKSSSNSKLFPSWEKSILGNVKDKGKISFIKFQQPVEAPFWYSVEDTFHSADYIVKQELPALKWWSGSIKEEKSKRGDTINCLDVGSNGGFYSLVSRSMGCNVMAVDAQPWCLTRLSSSAAINGYTDKFNMKWTAVSDQKDLTIDVGGNKCSGLWAVMESDWINKESNYTVSVKSTPLLEIVNDWIKSTEIISLFKIDAEGSELAILKSALPLFQQKRIINVLVEIAPGRSEKILPFEGKDGDGYGCKYVVNELYKAGYEFGHSFLLPKRNGTGIPREEFMDIMAPSVEGQPPKNFRNAPTLYTLTYTGA